ncbi:MULTISPECIES: GNAT family N-acetyltransferase [Paenibacillus]|uniref:GNAT family N-acetyltransferase n=1 Tax=Paenibacillus TaxID=44249 RepID=UPI0022B909AC|nr:GNAT family N-acetyltransferase [Paenibacillus caseinilyticus]MCZ8521708.1 GNAT family N-acetyltransferase [Paenibacillus caseinilyticus]
MSEVYRLADAGDAEELLALILGAYQTIRELNIAFTAAQADIDLVRGNIVDNSCYVLEIDGEIAATVSLKSLEEVTPHPFLYWLAVDPKRKGQGLGRKLLDHLEGTVIRQGLQASAVTLATSRKHPWLLAMYERRGYRPFFERDLGTDDKLVFLTKRLTEEAEGIPEAPESAGRRREGTPA